MLVFPYNNVRLSSGEMYLRWNGRILEEFEGGVEEVRLLQIQHAFTRTSQNKTINILKGNDRKLTNENLIRIRE